MSSPIALLLSSSTQSEGASQIKKVTTRDAQGGKYRESKLWRNVSEPRCDHKLVHEGLVVLARRVREQDTELVAQLNSLVATVGDLFPYVRLELGLTSGRGWTAPLLISGS